MVNFLSFNKIVEQFTTKKKPIESLFVTTIGFLI